MANLLNCSKISKSFSSHPLFEEISFSIEDDARIGLIGPNGAGKSTLLKILASNESADSGEITSKRSLRTAYLPQTDSFNLKLSIHQQLYNQTSSSLSDAERHGKVGEIVSLIGFESDDQLIESLSGGWKKRLAIASTLIKDPDLILLDEPTNHLDLEGIVWLEEFLSNATFAYVVISHDRTFLENSTTRIIEISRRYPKGFISVDGNYSEFLQRREDFLAQLSKQEQTLENTVKREIEWLRRGAKARSTKQNARIDRAQEMIATLGEVKSRAKAVTEVDIDFSNTGRETKQFVVLDKVYKSFGEKKILSNFSFTLLRGTKLGILGKNGSGKSTLLKLLSGSLEPDSGKIERAHALKIVTFEQQRSSLNLKQTLRRFLSPDGDQVVFQDSLLHIVSYAKKFRFDVKQLDVPIAQLSGGEQARLLIAKLMLQPADLLLLDEPTNDLDIDTLQVLEENLISFPGAVVLITHDRFMIDSVCTRFVAVEDNGAEFFSSYDQWKEFQRTSKSKVTKSGSDGSVSKKVSSSKDIQKVEKAIEKAEKNLKNFELEVAKNSMNPLSEDYRLACENLNRAKAKVDELLAEWESLSG
jgi:ATP-binding cassette subfamily F protein uup